MKSLLTTSLLTVLPFVSIPSYAQTATGTFQTSTNVQSSCKLLKNPEINIGTYSGLEISEEARDTYTPSIEIQCTAGTNGVVVTIDEGQNAGPGSTCDNPIRRMKSAEGNFFSYRLDGFEKISLVRREWGCSSSNNFTLPLFEPSDTSNHLDTILHIPAQNVKAGTYTDTLNITVEF